MYILWLMLFLIQIQHSCFKIPFYYCCCLLWKIWNVREIFQLNEKWKFNILKQHLFWFWCCFQFFILNVELCITSWNNCMIQLVKGKIMAKHYFFIYLILIIIISTSIKWLFRRFHTNMVFMLNMHNRCKNYWHVFD